MQPTKVNPEELAANVIGRDIVNKRGLFHVTSSRSWYNTITKAWMI